MLKKHRGLGRIRKDKGVRWMSKGERDAAARRIQSRVDAYCRGIKI